MTIANTSADSSSPAESIYERVVRLGDVWRRRYTQAPSALSALSVKICASLGTQLLTNMEGGEHLHSENDPFIVVLNHNQKLEALYVPGLLMHLRQGKMIHFLADWNFCLVPGVWLFYHFGQVITIARKPAKPRFLNVFKPLFTSCEPGFARAQRALQEGRSIGIFPEGTTNRDPKNLLRGFNGAAQLSLQTQAPILPIGIRFPYHDPSKPIPEFIPMSLKIGHPMHPQPVDGKPKLEEIRGWHRQVMEMIGDLSGKSWQPRNRRK
ncbi:MAG: hypothetical protein M2R45_04518 [Verrucomicrobia subdivision 3 bacterium]|nr:hypothetical protein [Limisphaerales bacterium]MCS1415935.1 hypothetical protein [Limisphaerales bacterium]